jgi:DNA-binding NarL/FixJ family response regulator
MVRHAETPQAPKRILVVDDHPLVRQSLTTYLGVQPGLQVAGEAADIGSARALLPHGDWHLAIVDLFLGGEFGLELIKDIHAWQPRLPILAISCADDEAHVHHALTAGATGFWHKAEPVPSLLVAVRKSLAKEQYLNAQLGARLYEWLTRLHAPGNGDHVTELSGRELEVFELTGQGCAAEEIAARLHLDIHTVETYRARIKTKLGLPHGTALAACAGRWLADPRRDFRAAHLRAPSG